VKAHCLVQDNDAHWYVIPDSRRLEWFAWLEIDPDDERAWDAPEWAVSVNGAPNRVTFDAYDIG